MAQASSAQREPSMEEILASIRRIIEDNDVEKRRDAEDAEPAFAPANDIAEHSRQDDAAPLAFRETDYSAGTGEAESGERLADAAVEPHAEALSHSLDNDALESDAPDHRLILPEAVAAAPTARMEPEASPQSPEPFDRNDEIVREAEDATTDAQQRPPLISEHAGRQVAAAFGELSEAFAASRRRSFDEMAEEMLRPMLQEWLDNNLPHLVERLVREEIERIARG